MFSEVTDCTVKMDSNTGRLCAFRFILFKDAARVEKMLQQNTEHLLDGKQVDPKEAMAMKMDPVEKICAGPETAEQKIQEYFGVFGETESMQLPMDPKPNKRKAFVFGTFKEESPVKTVLEKKSHTVKGSKCEIKFGGLGRGRVVHGSMVTNMRIGNRTNGNRAMGTAAVAVMAYEYDYSFGYYDYDG